ncbi:MAG: hypothetical protein EGQ58_00135, partial [Phocaeicola dorei]|nr:hypothetical protein [Phocaeicola dorei]
YFLHGGVIRFFSFVLLSLLPGNTFSVGNKISCSIHTYQYPLIMNLTMEGKDLFLFLLFLCFVINTCHEKN